MGARKQDLVGYKKFKDKEVSSAARGLAGLFREIAPAMLAKKDRGRGADLQAAPLQYGANAVSDCIMGADLLQADLLKAAQGSDAEDDGDHGQDGAAVSGDEVDLDAQLDSEPGSDASNASAAESDGEELEGEVPTSRLIGHVEGGILSEGLGPCHVGCIMHFQDVDPVVSPGWRLDAKPVPICTLLLRFCLGSMLTSFSSEALHSLRSYTTSEKAHNVLLIDGYHRCRF